MTVIVGKESRWFSKTIFTTTSHSPPTCHPLCSPLTTTPPTTSVANPLLNCTSSLIGRILRIKMGYGYGLCICHIFIQILSLLCLSCLFSCSEPDKEKGSIPTSFCSLISYLLPTNERMEGTVPSNSWEMSWKYSFQSCKRWFVACPIEMSYLCQLVKFLS